MPSVEILRPEQLTIDDREAWAAMLAAEPAFASPLLTFEFFAAVAAHRPDARVAVWRRRGEVGFGVATLTGRPALWERVTEVPAALPLKRLGPRFDHIASVEPTPPGRLAGLGALAAGAHRRLAAA